MILVVPVPGHSLPFFSRRGSLEFAATVLLTSSKKKANRTCNIPIRPAITRISCLA